MKIECDVVRDLMPLYTEDLTNEGSNEYLLKHIKNCRECKEVFDELQKESVDKKENKMLDIEDIPPKKLVKRIRNRIITIVIMVLFMGQFYI